MNCLDLWAIGPELALALTCLLLVPLAGLVRGKWRALPSIFAGFGMVVALFLNIQTLNFPQQAVFCGTYALDGFGSVFKLLIIGSALLALLPIAAYFHGRDAEPHAPVALMFAVLGGVALAGSLDLGLIVLFLQMLSTASYLLVSVTRGGKRANEATLKYFIYGAVALAVMAYGLSFLYGLTGSLSLSSIGAALGGADPVWVWVALTLILVGYAFEITAVPFHFWAPDVYAGASAPVTGFISVLPKIAGFAGLLRLLLIAFPNGLSGWPILIAVLAALTMLLGNLAALRQTRLKRLLAYSSIAQAGYVLMAVAVAGTVPGALSAAGYYLAAYAFMNLAAFTVVAQFERKSGQDQLTSLRGLSKTAPGTAALLTLALLSLAGIPPLAGFLGKVLLLQMALSGGLTWLAVFAALNMVLGLYYYLRPVVEMYLRSPEGETELHREPGYGWALGLTTFGTLLLGIWPAPALALLSGLARMLH
ncbi:NADH-quinone oxidoreductase subunit N [Deinococcus detaillensis]|uniref:NADH-quinone oxidoreductase subunit N n=1 Tax=Deinococcus detaillensis TaxID=2592048 RepID=A0A553UZ63_9DEIO|nr:NADH-quinone oxidoreductase subunit N [Deinococcus detaillensis]TSA85514.1 NADH-quinone oxidoreductase subunit N [Deinococcus detaillensis]